MSVHTDVCKVCLYTELQSLCLPKRRRGSRDLCHLSLFGPALVSAGEPWQYSATVVLEPRVL